MHENISHSGDGLVQRREKAADVGDALSSPPSGSGWEAVGQTRWHLSQCSSVGSQCRRHFPEARASKWEESCSPGKGVEEGGHRGKVSEKKVRERMSGVTIASAQVPCFFKCFSFATKRRKQNQHHLPFLFVYPLVPLQTLTGKVGSCWSKPICSTCKRKGRRMLK